MSSLNGLRVVDFTINVSGPFASMILGDLGAEVIKVERVGRGDDCRAWGPFSGDEGCYFLDVNRNKQSVCVDLKTAEGRDVARRLATAADVVLENFRPGVMPRLGLGYDELRELNPRLVYCSISAYGQSGPKRTQGGFDPTLQALSGMMLSSGSDGDPPFRIGPSVIDKGSSLWAAIAILAALHERHATGAGKYVDVSLLSTAVSWLSYDVVSYLATGERPARLGTAAPGSVPSQAFRTSDGHVHVAVGNDRIWAEFCTAIDRTDLRDDPRFARNEDRLRARQALVEILDDVFGQRTKLEWLERLSAAGIPCAPVNDVAEAIDDPQVQHLGLVAEVDRNGRGPFVYVRSPVVDGDLAAPPPELGEHTDDVLAAVLGLTSREIESLRELGAVA